MHFFLPLFQRLQLRVAEDANHLLAVLLLALQVLLDRAFSALVLPLLTGLRSRTPFSLTDASSCRSGVSDSALFAQMLREDGLERTYDHEEPRCNQRDQRISSDESQY